MPDPGPTKFRPRSILWTGLLIFAAAFWLRVEANDLCTHWVHMQGSPGTDKNAEVTDSYRVEAYVEVARVGLGLGAILCAVSLSAWVFIPSPGPVSTLTDERSERAS